MGPESVRGQTYCLDDSSLVYRLEQPSYGFFLYSVPGTGNARYPYKITLFDDGRITGSGYYTSSLLQIFSNALPPDTAIIETRWLLPDNASGKWTTDLLGERLFFDFANQLVDYKGQQFDVWWWEGIDQEWGKAAQHSVPDSSGFKTAGLNSFIDYDGSITSEYLEILWVRCEP